MGEYPNAGLQKYPPHRVLAGLGPREAICPFFSLEVNVKKATALLCGMLMLAVGANIAFGRPPYKEQFEKTYKESKIADTAKEAKCNICHFGKEKKNRNDYGTALSKLLTEEKFKELKGKPEDLTKSIQEALKKVSAEKSVSGKTFGELIEAGKLPGTAPAEK